MLPYKGLPVGLAQNIKKLLGNAAKTMLKVVLAVVVTVILIFIPVGLLFRVFDWSGLLAFLIACLLTWVVKFAFLDSFILCQTMAGYMEVAPNTEITFDLYEKLCGLSGKFRELWNKGKEESVHQDTASEIHAEIPNMEAQPTAEQSPATPEPATEPVAKPAAEPAARPRFCGQCGSKLTEGSRFCSTCGASQM